MVFVTLAGSKFEEKFDYFLLLLEAGYMQRCVTVLIWRVGVHAFLKKVLQHFRAAVKDTQHAKGVAVVVRVAQFQLLKSG